MRAQVQRTSMDLFKLLMQQIERQSVGTLTLGRMKRFREIFFDRDAVYLAGNEFAGKVEFDSLLSSTRVLEKIDVASLEAIILSTDLNRHLLAQVLLDQGLIDAGEVKPLAEAQLMEEFLHLFARDGGSFHYQEGRVPECLLQYDAIHTQTPVSLTRLVEALGQRLEFMKKCSEIIPSVEETFVITEKGMAYKQSNSEDFVLQRIFGMIDGFRDLSTILADSFFFEPVILSTIYQALENGHLKKARIPELNNLQPAGFTRDEAARHLPIFKNAVRHGVDELGARGKLAIVYEKLGMVDDAVIQYNFIGDALFRMNKAGKAIKAYQAALALKPGEQLLTDKITEIYISAAEDEHASGNVDQSVQLLIGALKLRPDDEVVGARVVQILGDHGRFDELDRICSTLLGARKSEKQLKAALCLLESAVGRHPTHTGMRKQLINLYVDLRMPESAIEHMEVLAKAFADKGDVARAQDLLVKIQRLEGTTRAPTRVSSKILQKKKGRRSSTRKSRVKRVALWIFLLVFMAYQAWSFMNWNVVSERFALPGILAPRSVNAKSLVESLPEEQRDALQIVPASTELRFRNLILACDRFMYKHPASLFSLQAKSFRDWARTNIRLLERLRETNKQRILDDAHEDFEEQGDVDRATSLLAQLFTLPDSDPFHGKALQLKAEFARRRVPSATEVVRRAEKFTAIGQYDSASEQLRELASRYPNSEAAKSATVPLRVISVPSGAKVFEHGKDEPVGTTPCVVRIPLQIDSMILHLKRSGFSDVSEFVTSEKLFEYHGKIVRALGRSKTREIATRHPAHKTPIISQNFAQNLVFWGDNRGSLLWFRLGDSASVRQRFVTSGGNVRHAPTLGDDALYSLWEDGKIRRLPYEELTRMNPRVQTFALNQLSSTNLCRIPKRRLVLTATDGQIHAVDSGGIRSLLSRRKESTLAELRRPTVLRYNELQDQIVVADRQGFIRGFKIRSSGPRHFFSPTWSRHISDEAVTALYISDHVVVAKSGSELHLAPLEEGKPVSRTAASWKTVAAPSAYCVHASGAVFTWSKKSGLRRHGVDRTDDAPPPELTEIIGAQELERLIAMPRSIAALYQAANELGERVHRVLFFDIETFQPQWAIDCPTAPLHVSGDEKWVVVAEEATLSLYEWP